MSKESVSLFYKEGGSDKVYSASIEETSGGCLVNFQYGRRGSAMSTGSKTSKPVPYNEAKKVFDKLIREKTAKGYKPDAAGAEYLNASREERDTGLRPQLLNPIEEDECERLIKDADYWMQEKHDGRRCLIKKTGHEVIGTNRMGLSVGLPKTIIDSALAVKEDFTVDGELMGDFIIVFDLLEGSGMDKANCYLSRLGRLEKLGTMFGGDIRTAATAKTTAEKKSMFEQLKKANAEGVVFKRHDAIYKPGRPSTGGDQLKFKFYATASCIVAEGRSGKRSVALQLMDGIHGDKVVQVGNVTVPANQDIPKVGQIVEIRYLYAYPGGSLFQPTLLGVRDDVNTADCTVKQLKFKATDQDDDS